MNVRIDPRSERLIERQLRAGRFHSPEEVVARALEALAEKEPGQSEAMDREQAVRDMLDFAGKHGFTLRAGLAVRDLIQEGRKY